MTGKSAQSPAELSDNVRAWLESPMVYAEVPHALRRNNCAA